LRRPPRPRREFLLCAGHGDAALEAAVQPGVAFRPRTAVPGFGSPRRPASAQAGFLLSIPAAPNRSEPRASRADRFDLEARATVFHGAVQDSTANPGISPDAAHGRCAGDARRQACEAEDGRYVVLVAVSISGH